MNNLAYNPALLSGYSTQSVSSFAPTWNASMSPNNISDLKVNGIESVKAYPMTPNSKVILFDANEDIFYCKETDISNYPTIRIFGYKELKTPEAKSSNYVTLSEFNEFKEEVLNGQQHIWDLVSKSGTGLSSPTDKADDERIGAKSESATNVTKPIKSKSSI